MTRSDRGSVTAELAVALPALVILLVVGLSAITAVTAKLGCVATARDTVLALSRGGTPPTPDGARISYNEDTVTVAITRTLITCDATAVMEP